MVSDQIQKSNFASNLRHLIDFWRLFMMANVINFIGTPSGRPSLTFRQSQLLAVQAFRDELGPQDALLVPADGFQIA